MKKVFAIFAIAGIMVACGNKADKKADAMTDSANKMIDSANNMIEQSTDSATNMMNNAADSAKQNDRSRLSRYCKIQDAIIVLIQYYFLQESKPRPKRSGFFHVPVPDTN